VKTTEKRRLALPSTLGALAEKMILVVMPSRHTRPEIAAATLLVISRLPTAGMDRPEAVRSRERSRR
jgi:hypothetical protein